MMVLNLHLFGCVLSALALSASSLIAAMPSSSRASNTLAYMLPLSVPRHSVFRHRVFRHALLRVRDNCVHHHGDHHCPPLCCVAGNTVDHSFGDCLRKFLLGARLSRISFLQHNVPANLHTHSAALSDTLRSSCCTFVSLA